MLYNFWILLKLIKSLIVLVSSKLWYAYKFLQIQNYFCIKFLKINYLN